MGKRQDKIKRILYEYYILSVGILSGVGMFFIMSGLHQSVSRASGAVAWRFNPGMIAIGVVFMVCAVLLYKDARGRAK